MTQTPSCIDLAILCEPGTHFGTVAPFLDLASIARHYLSEFEKGPGAVGVQVDLLQDERLGPSWLPGCAAINFERTARCYAVVMMPSANIDRHEFRPDALRSAWLQMQHAAGAKMGAIGSGVMALLDAGLLGSGPASLPPRFSRLARARYPEVALAHTSAVAETGRIITASEPASIFALIVALTRRFHSQGLAERFRRTFGVRETDMPGSSLLPARGNQDMLIADARAWIMAHMHEPIDSKIIAKRFGVSTRTLSRRFESSTGATPARFIREVRLEAARSMLERTGFSVEQIAHMVGYRDVAFFRQLFARETGCSPRSFRMSSSATTFLV